MTSFPRKRESRKMRRRNYVHASCKVNPVRTKYYPPSALAEVLAGLRGQGKRIVFTNGCFDLLHSGHLHTLSQAKRLGDVLVVGLNSDASVKRLKGAQRPIVRETE